MTETETTALLEKETAEAAEAVGTAKTAEPAGTPLTVAAVPEPETEPAALEKNLRRLEEQSALQTALAKKRLFWVRLGSVFLGVTMLIVLVTVTTLMPQLEAALDTAGGVMENLTQLSAQLQEADLPAILENLDKTLTQSRSSLVDVSEAVRSISSIDFAGLNDAILDLQRVLRNPLGSLFGRG